MAANDLIVPRFYIGTKPNPRASQEAGRPIFKQMEMCELRFAGDRRKVSVFPAHEIEPNATRERGKDTTYAELYADQYRSFKATEQQEVSGTPLSEAPFLTEARRKELRAVNVHSVEALASIDGAPLKNLGPGGREDKEKAMAYLAKAADSADVTAMASQIAALQQQLREQTELIQEYATRPKKAKFQRAIEARLRKEETEPEQAAAEQPAASEPTEPEARSIDDLSDAELKAYIKEQSGEPVRGNPSRETLIARATELAEDDED